jgi:transcriptional regulator with XRE-family HTH domain
LIRFSKILKKLLVQRNVTQAQLSKRTNLSKSIVSKIISGTQEIRYSQIVLCAKALDLDPGDFFERKDGRTNFNPIINKDTIIRPQFEDATGKLFIYSVYVINEFIIPDISLSLQPNSINIVYIISGAINYNGILRRSGEVFIASLGKGDKEDVHMHAGSQYLVCIVTNEPHSFEDILGRRQKGMV